MGVMAAVGYMAAETGSETQGGPGVKPGARGAGLRLRGGGHASGWKDGQTGWMGVVTGESWSERSTKTTGKSRRERGHNRMVGP